MYDPLDYEEVRRPRPRSKKKKRLKVFLRSRKEVTDSFDLDPAKLKLKAVIKSDSSLGFNLYKIVEVFHGKDIEVLVEPLDKEKKTHEQEQPKSKASERRSSKQETAMENKRPSRKARQNKKGGT